MSLNKLQTDRQTDNALDLQWTRANLSVSYFSWSVNILTGSEIRKYLERYKKLPEPIHNIINDLRGSVLTSVEMIRWTDWRTCDCVSKDIESSHVWNGHNHVLLHELSFLHFKRARVPPLCDFIVLRNFRAAVPQGWCVRKVQHVDWAVRHRLMNQGHGSGG
jgi:hypothetical protein